MLDLILAIVHHLLIFGLFGVLLAELVIVRAGMSETAIRRMAAVDVWYGVFAGLILVVGFCRAVFAAKGWFYYEHNLFFWLKIGTFLLIGLLSVPPTLTFFRWRRSPGLASAQAIAGVRRLLWIELVLFALLPAFAAAMARGFGEFG
jgi:putative membrane protein